MTNPGIDVWLKRVWLVNGVVLLGALVIGFGFAAFAVVGDWRGQQGLAVAAPSPDGIAEKGLRAVRFDVPVRVRGTNTQMVLVHNGADYLPAGSGESSTSKQYDRSGGDGPTVNVAFLSPNGAPGHLLFDGPAFVSRVSYPGESDGRADSLQTWITYEAVLTDTNGDGSLDENDERELLVTDLNGNNLRHVLPPGFRFREFSSLQDQKSLVVTAIELPKGSTSSVDARRARERAFLYDVASARLQPLGTLDSLVTAAAKAMTGHIPSTQSR